MKAFIPKEASGKEGSAGDSTEDCCFKVWDCPVRERYQRAAIEVPNAAQHVAQAALATGCIPAAQQAQISVQTGRGEVSAF